MNDYAQAIAVLGVLLLLGAWQEYAAGNQRDAKLIAGFGTGGILAGAYVWLA